MSSNTFAHGMNKPGPNNGYIRMPSTYHIELLPDKNILKIYFLDISFKSLPMASASVKVSLKGLLTDVLVCTKGVAFFSCNTKEFSMAKYSEILIESSKAGEKSVISTYKLPLSY